MAVVGVKKKKKKKLSRIKYLALRMVIRLPKKEMRTCVAESEKIAEPLGERMIRVANQLIGSPPIAKCSGEIFQEKLRNEFDNPRNPHPPHDSMEIDAYIKEVVSEQRSTAQNPIYLGEKNSVDRFVLFISAFRSALFLEGSNYKMYHLKLR